MSRLWRVSAIDRSCPGAPSRRAIVTALTLAPLSGVPQQASPSMATDRAVNVCEAWLALNQEADRLQAHWSRLEHDLVRDHHWYKLTERQRCMLPAAQALFDIDERIEALHQERDILLARIPELQAATTFGLAAKLAVAAVVVSPDDHAEAHHLIASILRDLKMMPAPGA